MARTVKKKKELTLEEKLAEALAPVEEQPYQVPENWCWTKLSSCIIASKEKTADFTDSNIKYIGLEHLEKDSGIIGYGSAGGVKSLKNVFHKGQLLYGKLRPYLNKHDIAPFDGICSTDILVFDKTECSLTSFVNYYFNQSRFLEYVVGNSKGINLPRVSENVILEAMVPLPPLPEQQRIVDRIESLFAKLDEAKEKAQTVVDGFEDRKAAILHKAFTGELTAGWRENTNPLPAKLYLQNIIDNGECFSRKEFKYWTNESLPNGWAESKIGNLLYFAGRIGWKGLKAEEYTEEGPLLLSVYNLNDGDEVTYHRVYHITEARYEESPEIMVQVGDVLLTKDGAGIGKLGYVKELPQKATINSSLLLIRPANAAISKYIYYILLGPNLQRIVKERITGSATPHLFQRDIKDFTIPVPSLDEQRQIVHVLDEMLNKEQQAKEAAEQVISQIDTMKKSILARAFRGELGTNDPADESAVELLKRIL